MGDFLRAAASYLRPYWRQALLIVLSQAPATAFITLQPLLLRSLIDDAIVPSNAHLAGLLIAVAEHLASEITAAGTCIEVRVQLTLPSVKVSPELASTP